MTVKMQYREKKSWTLDTLKFFFKTITYLAHWKTNFKVFLTKRKFAPSLSIEAFRAIALHCKSQNKLHI